MGLSKRGRNWYISNIVKILEKEKRVTTRELLMKLSTIPQKKYPIQEERIISFLRYLRAIRVITYHKEKGSRVGVWIWLEENNGSS